MGTTTVRILLVEDFEPYRALIGALLSGKAGFQVVGEVSDGLQAVTKAQELRPDLILMDINLPMISGIEAARRIRELVPVSKIVFVTKESDVDVIREAHGLGAQGYIAKTKASTELLTGLAAVLEGELFISSGLPRNGFPSAKD